MVVRPHHVADLVGPVEKFEVGRVDVGFVVIRHGFLVVRHPCEDEGVRVVEPLLVIVVEIHHLELGIGQ